MKKGEAPMKVEISVPEVVSIFKEIQEQSKSIFEMIRAEIRENVGEYLSKLMDIELTHFLGREWYEHGQGDVNHRNGSYGRNFTLTSLRLIKRRTKPMETVAGENACYSLLAFICLKMELHWRSNPIGKVRNNLTFQKELGDKKFTQKT
jgi:hypothetical protein